jgi:hypothetical protein
LTQSKKKDLLRSIIDHIKVSFDGVNKTHQLDVNFRIPMLVENLGSQHKSKPQIFDYSTVTDFALGLDSEKPGSVKEYLTMSVRLTSSNLWLSPYSLHQQNLFDQIRSFHDEGGMTFVQISDYLNLSGTLTPRGKEFTHKHVWSIYTKKMRSIERFGREFDPVVLNTGVDVITYVPD